MNIFNKIQLLIGIPVIFILLISNSGFAQSKMEDEFKMKQYFFVMLTTGHDRSHDSTTAARIMEGHLANIERLFNEKKLVLAGPFLDNSNWRGIFIFDVPTEKEVIEMLETDPAIKNKRLAYEIHPWYGPGIIKVKE